MAYVHRLLRALVDKSSPFVDDSRGATAMEYAIMIAMISAVLVGILATPGMQTSLTGDLGGIANTLNTVTN